MSKQLRWILCIVMAAAVTLIAVCSASFLDLGRQLHDCEDQLAASRESWENTAAEKEVLQADLKTLRETLKEASLSLSEATERAEELKADISSLQKEIDGLKTASD